MLKHLFPLLALLFASILPAQERIRLTHSCSYDGEENATDYYSFAPSTEADGIVLEICNAMGLEKNFVIKSANVRNAVATMADGKRVILYSTLFLEKFKIDTRTKWAAYSVMAHEIGHHLNGHNFNEPDAGKRKSMELQADKFSGSALRLLNAPLDDAKAGTEIFALEGETKTHPAGSARREAVASGWKLQDERLKALGVASTTRTPVTASDRDGDGVSDTADKCPDDFGLSATGGCPDGDDDGIPDADDACKYQKGPVAWQGCPDSDGDSLPDHQDQCPNAPGLAANKGCPPADRDADGVPDTADKCPDLAGARNWQGCPDSDGDGIPDHDDKCPTEKGTFALGGCAEKTQPTAAADRFTDPTVGVMIKVAGGTFQMGSNDGDSDEKPVHPVSLHDYYLAETEVTQAQWRAVMGSDPPELYHKNCDKCPVEKVSWEDVQTFLQKLNSRAGGGYRLPTEAEWEYAARGGKLSKGFKYAGSNDIDEVAWYSKNTSETKPVKGKKANELGFFDMSGNVYEWCSDWKGDYPSGSVTNPTGPGSGSYRVIRGGAWGSGPQYCRSASRYDVAPGNRNYGIGFRLARTVNF